MLTLEFLAKFSELAATLRNRSETLSFSHLKGLIPYNAVHALHCLNFFYHDLSPDTDILIVFLNKP